MISKVNLDIKGFPLSSSRATHTAEPPNVDDPPDAFAPALELPLAAASLPLALAATVPATLPLALPLEFSPTLLPAAPELSAANAPSNNIVP